MIRAGSQVENSRQGDPPGRQAGIGWNDLPNLVFSTLEHAKIQFFILEAAAIISREILDMAELDETNYIFTKSKSSNNNLLIAFLNKTSSGDYEGIDYFAEVDCHLLVVNSHRMPWRGAKLDDLLSLIPVAQEEIEGFIKDLNPSTISCFGFSLSGFPAIYMGAAFGADKILVLSPELTIGFEGSRSQYHLRGKPTTFPHPDLLDYVGRYELKDLTIIVGEEQPVDLYYASRFKGVPGVSLFSIEGVGHQVFSHLRSKNVILPHLTPETAQDGKQARGVRWGRIFTTSVPEAWFEGLRARKGKDYVAAEALLRDVVRTIPDNHVAAGDLAEVLRHRAKYSEALEILDRIADKFPARSRIHKLKEQVAGLAFQKAEKIRARKLARKEARAAERRDSRSDAEAEG